MSGSRVDEIVDAVAANGAVAGVLRVFGMGSGKVMDPLRAGQTVQAGVPGVTQIEAGDWFVLPPTSNNWAFGDATSTQITRRIEGRFFVPKSDLTMAYRSLVGIENAFVVAFTDYHNATLSDVCAEVHVTGTSYSADANWAWLSIALSVLELVNLNG